MGNGRDEVWKEQLGFVSGTALVWGAILIQLWPIIARVQIDSHSHVIPTRLEVTGLQSWWFQVSILPIALGAGIVVLGATHLVARGLWLVTLSTEDDGSPSVATRLADYTYLMLHIYWLLALLMLVLLVPLGGLKALGNFVAPRLGWSIVRGELVVAGISCVIFGAIAVGFLYRHRLWWRTQIGKHLAWAKGRDVFKASILLTLLWMAVGELCFIAELRIDQSMYQLSTDKYALAFVELGGATSDPQHAKVTIQRGATPPVPVVPRPAANGVYVVPISLTGALPSEYVIELTYPHPDVSVAFPFIRTIIKRRAGFVVVP